MIRKENILKELKKRGYKITGQRETIIEVLISNRCLSCKDIYYQAIKQDPTIGIATVYRFIKILETCGFIDRDNLFQISKKSYRVPDDQIILIDHQNEISLEKGEWYISLRQMLQDYGYIDNHDLSVVITKIEKTK
ncbi:transcriptional repressor [Mobilitalea sibirica]|uniref:Transcriptional repressor n=1 Tax=Mobilitalea sibirica TaxID=1462919 RepID=A0A8J7KS63_9FIRM|nr:transcriptional repressor [Mobilitalea sibirica]